MNLAWFEFLFLGLYFALVFWMLLDAVQRNRGWIRWQVLLYFVAFLAVPVWLFRRRRWPVTVEIHGFRQLKFAALALAIVAATFILSPALGSAVATNLFHVARVEGQAMSPTLNDQDRLVVNKRAYRASDPAIGDIVLLRYPLNPEKMFVKRVIAAGGDELQIVDGVVFRNGGRVDEPYVLEASRSQDGWGPLVVPEGMYFVLGDRRNNSSDSRHWGHVPREYILGRVALRWWPVSTRRRF